MTTMTDPDKGLHPAAEEPDPYDTGHVYDGIHEHDNALPRWWLWTFAITVVFSLAYWFVEHSLPSAQSSFDEYGEAQRQYDLNAFAAAVDPQAIVAMAEDPSVIARGKTIFANRCQTCHGEEAQGLPANGPNLTDSYWIHGGDIRSIFTTVAGGYPKLGMPEWRFTLEDAELQALVALIQSQRNSNLEGRGPQGELYEGEGM
jgi:cytochrome c oxidase cbb3-type subunit 3